MIKIFGLLLLLIFNITFADIYIAKNIKEKEFLDTLKKEQLSFGLLNEEFYSKKIVDNQSINDLIKHLLSDYLNLNITYENLNFYKEENNLKKLNYLGTALINRENSKENHIDFTQTIFNNQLYVVSTKNKIHSLSELNNKNIYYLKGSIYNMFLESLLNRNDLKANLIEVININDYKNKLILTPNPAMYAPINRIRIGYTSGVAIAINQKYSDLVPILNKALDERYRYIIAEKLKKSNKKLILNNFYSSLTITEKKYLSSLKKLNISYRNNTNSLVLYYDKNVNIYKGIAPNILNLLEELLNIKIQDVTTTTNNSDITISSKTLEKDKKKIFSNKFYDIGVYLVHLKNKNKNKNKTIGVLSNSIEKVLVQKYDISKDIKIYNTYPDLIDALNSRKVDNILIIKNDFDPSKYNVTLFEKAPVNFSFNKNNILLKNIFNKALYYLIDSNSIIEKSTFERNNLQLIKNNNNKMIKNSLIILSLFLFVTLLIIIIILIMESKHKKELLRDPLSKLPNRSVFNNFCEQKNNIIYGYSFVIDIDNFKEINDKYGHNFGDSIIVELSRFLKLKFDDSYIFRISGDEFYGLFLENYSSIKLKLNKIEIESILFAKYNVTFSTGLYKKEIKDNIHTSFRYADMALLEAKKNKDISVVLADDLFIKKKERELKILELLENDLKELYAVYQPKIKISSGAIIGAEALARCYSEELKDIYPDELIPIAENFNLIHKIDYKIAAESIKYIKKLINLKMINDGFRISFNLSVKTFLRDDLIDTITKILEREGVSGKYIEIEITETILVEDIKNILLKLSKLIDFSIQISLDDFTAGHSTAKLLPILPIDIIKFDKSLLDSLETNEEKAKIVYSNLATLVKKLKLKIVSEGIETKKQLDFLKKIDINYGQGYLFSRPLKEKDFFDFIKSN